MDIGAIRSSYPATPPSGSAAARPDDKTQNGGLSQSDLVLLDRLKARDSAVRAHEQAHLAVAGSLALSGASYTYQRGPNGVNYAIGGEVQIDTSPGRTPEETIERARRIEAAALAPADPSGPDRAIAAAAQQMALRAQAELASQYQQQQRPGARVDVHA